MKVDVRYSIRSIGGVITQNGSGMLP